MKSLRAELYVGELRGHKYTMVSTTYIAVIVNVLSFLLPKLGVEIGSEQLTSTIQTLITLGSGLWILIQRYQKGDVNVLGVRR